MFGLGVEKDLKQVLSIMNELVDELKKESSLNENQQKQLNELQNAIQNTGNQKLSSQEINAISELIFNKTELKTKIKDLNDSIPLVKDNNLKQNFLKVSNQVNQLEVRALNESKGLHIIKNKVKGLEKLVRDLKPKIEETSYVVTQLKQESIERKQFTALLNEIKELHADLDEIKENVKSEKQKTNKFDFNDLSSLTTKAGYLNQGIEKLTGLFSEKRKASILKEGESELLKSYFALHGTVFDLDHLVRMKSETPSRLKALIEDLRQELNAFEQKLSASVPNAIVERNKIDQNRQKIESKLISANKKLNVINGKRDLQKVSNGINEIAISIKKQKIALSHSEDLKTDLRYLKQKHDLVKKQLNSSKKEHSGLKEISRKLMNTRKQLIVILQKKDFPLVFIELANLIETAKQINVQLKEINFDFKINNRDLSKTGEAHLIAQNLFEIEKTLNEIKARAEKENLDSSLLIAIENEIKKLVSLFDEESLFISVLKQSHEKEKIVEQKHGFDDVDFILHKINGLRQNISDIHSNHI